MWIQARLQRSLGGIVAVLEFQVRQNRTGPSGHRELRQRSGVHHFYSPDDPMARLISTEIISRTTTDSEGFDALVTGVRYRIASDSYDARDLEEQLAAMFLRERGDSFTDFELDNARIGRQYSGRCDVRVRGTFYTEKIEIYKDEDHDRR